MIGWKADFGYYRSSYTPQLLSDIVFYDTDRYFMIYDGIDIKIDETYSSTNIDSIVNELQNIFGNSYHSVYNFYYYRDNTGFHNKDNFWRIILPSIRLMTPECLNEYQANTIHHSGPIIYIKPLNRVISYSFNTLYPSVFRVGDDGNTLELLYRYNVTSGTPCNFGLVTGSATNACIPLLKIKSPTKEDLLDASNYITLRVGLTYSSNRVTDVRIYNVGPTITDEAKSFYMALFSDYVAPDYQSGDGPYEPGGDSGEGDLPPGTFDDDSDPIPDSSLPTLSSADTGFTRIYNPTLSQVQALARYLWTEPSIIDTIWNHIKQFFEDPMQAIIGFNLVPCRVPDGGTRSFALMFIDTGVQMNTAANQFVDVDCGTLELNRYYGSALDQNPYTKVSCYLPYIGTVHLNTDEVMGTMLQVKYRIDIVSGICVAKIFVDGSVLYQYSGHCAITIPISSADFSSYVSAAITVGTAVAGMAVGAGVGSAIEAAVVTSPTAIAPVEMTGNAEADLASLNMNIERRQKETKSQAATFSGLAEQSVSNTVGQVMSGKMQVEHSGSFSGNSGYLGIRRPYLIIERPNMCLPASYGSLNGYPSMITLSLKDCKGFTRVQQVQLTGCTATNSEQSEILQFLKSGVIL